MSIDKFIDFAMDKAGLTEEEADRFIETMESVGRVMRGEEPPPGMAIYG